MLHSYKKFKTINDPIYGFVRIPQDFIFQLMEHPYVQRLRRISQTSLTYMVFPGATHTRFHHVLGATHLTYQAIQVLRGKGHAISEEEEEAVLAAILLHDIGHGPFSHTLENTLIDCQHEYLSALFMEELNEQFDGRLSLAIEIFHNRYPRTFLHQLVSSQLDMDRLDYLRRDSFYTGVSEGMVNSDRILSMLDIANDELVLESKAVYSVEKFLVARRLMYWQVYLHKTVLSAEFLLQRILERARFLMEEKKVELSASPALLHFLSRPIPAAEMAKQLHTFAQLDDTDIWFAVKNWVHADDRILAMLSERLINRKLLKVKVSAEPFSEQEVAELKARSMKRYGIDEKEVEYFVFHGSNENIAYDSRKTPIRLLHSNKTVTPIPEDDDILDMNVFSHLVRRYYLCYPGS